jgi:hypothetical protein
MRQHAWLCLILLLPPPLPRGVPGEGPDCYFPKEIQVFGRFRPESEGLKKTIYILALSAAGHAVAGNTCLRMLPRARSAKAERCRCLRNKRPSKPYEFIGFGAMDVTKPSEILPGTLMAGPETTEILLGNWSHLQARTPAGPRLEHRWSRGPTVDRKP